MVRRHALLIGIGSYGEGLAAIPSARADLEALAEVLLDPALGGLQPQVRNRSRLLVEGSSWARAESRADRAATASPAGGYIRCSCSILRGSSCNICCASFSRQRSSPGSQRHFSNCLMLGEWETLAGGGERHRAADQRGASQGRW